MKLWINKCKAKKTHATVCLISLSLVFMIFSCDTDGVCNALREVRCCSQAPSDSITFFSNWCDIYKVVIVHGDRSDKSL